jgi:hypothetical protein
MTGMQTIFFLFNIPAYIRYYVEFFPWPFGYVFTFIVYLRGCIVIRFYFRNFVYHTHNNLLIVLLTYCTIAAFCYQYCVTKLYVESFSTVYDLLLSKDFFDRIFLMGKTTMSLPLQRLQSMQTEVLEMITEKALQEELVLITPLYQQMTTLKVNLIVLKELRHHLNVMSVSESQYFQQQPRAVQVSRMKAKLVKTLVESICSQFVQSLAGSSAISSMDGGLFSTFSMSGSSLGSGKDLTVKFVLRLHPALTLVKVDEDLFSSMLSFLLRQAIQKIERYVSYVKARSRSQRQMDGKTESGEEKKEAIHASSDGWDAEGEPSRFQEHEVLIWIRPPSTNVDVNGKSGGGVSSAATHAVNGSASGSGGASGAGMFKFTDVRTMLVTLFDTCKPIECSNKSASQSSRISPGVSLIPTGSPSSTCCPAATSYALCDRFMRFFESTVRYQTGELGKKKSKHYHSFQQVGVPYMLCPDSFRLQKFVEMTNAIGDHLVHRIEKQTLYHRYCYQYDEGLLGFSQANAEGVGDGNTAPRDDGKKSVKLTPDKRSKRNGLEEQFLSSPSSPMRNSSSRSALKNRGLKLQSSEPQSRRRFIGQAVVMTYDSRAVIPTKIVNSDGSGSAKTTGISFLARATLTNFFELISWSCHSVTVNYLHDILFSSEVQSCDCLLLDANLRVIVSPSPFLLAVTSLAQEIEMIANSSAAAAAAAQQTDVAGTLIADTKDIIHMLRHAGYAGLIVLLYPPTPPTPTAIKGETESMGIAADNSNDGKLEVSSVAGKLSSKSYATIDSKPWFNPNIHAVKADLHFQLPLTMDIVREISIASEKHILSGL